VKESKNMLTRKQIESATKKFVTQCNQYLYYTELGIEGIRLEAYSIELPASELDVAKAFSMFFKVLWWSEESDVRNVSDILYYAQFSSDSTYTEASLIEIFIKSALEEYDVIEWNKFDFPFLCFDTDKKMTPYYISTYR
jgi:hypothetical protein